MNATELRDHALRGESARTESVEAKTRILQNGFDNICGWHLSNGRVAMVTVSMTHQAGTANSGCARAVPMTKMKCDQAIAFGTKPRQMVLEAVIVVGVPI